MAVHAGGGLVDVAVNPQPSLPLHTERLVLRVVEYDS